MDSSRVVVKSTPCFETAKAGGGFLHVGVIGSAQAFRSYPTDILRRIFDITGLTVNAVLSINLKARFVTICDDFIHSRRAVTLSGFIIGRKIDLNRNRGVS